MSLCLYRLTDLMAEAGYSEPLGARMEGLELFSTFPGTALSTGIHGQGAVSGGRLKSWEEHLPWSREEICPSSGTNS